MKLQLIAVTIGCAAGYMLYERRKNDIDAITIKMLYRYELLWWRNYDARIAREKNQILYNAICIWIPFQTRPLKLYRIPTFWACLGYTAERIFARSPWVLVYVLWTVIRSLNHRKMHGNYLYSPTPTRGIRLFTRVTETFSYCHRVQRVTRFGQFRRPFAQCHSPVTLWR